MLRSKSTSPKHATDSSSWMVKCGASLIAGTPEVRSGQVALPSTMVTPGVELVSVPWTLVNAPVDRTSTWTSMVSPGSQNPLSLPLSVTQVSVPTWAL